MVILDVIVGAEPEELTGFAHIFFGGITMDNSADLTLSGVAFDDKFGNSVSTTGDVNRDGYSDVIVGAPGNDAGGTVAGRAYLYLSSPPPVKPRIMSVKDVPLIRVGK